MLAKTSGRIVMIAGLFLSGTLAWGQFTPSGQQAEADAYRTLNNHMYQTVDASRLGQFPPAPSRFPVTQTAFGQSPTPATSPTPAFATPTLNLGVATGSGTAGNAGGTVPGNAAPAPVPFGGAGVAANATPQLVPYVPDGGYDWSSSGVVMGAGPGAVCADGSCDGGLPLQIGGNPLAAGCGNCCRGCCRFCFGAEYLYWWTKGMRVPELVTTSPVGTGPATAGIKGVPTTTVLFGGNRMDNDGVSGGRFRGSLALDCNCCNKLDVEYFFLGDNDFDYSWDSPADYDILARPYYNPWIGAEDAEFVGYPGLVEGRIDISGSTRFDGWGMWWRHNLLCCGCGGGCGAVCDDGCDPCGDDGGIYGGGPLAGFGGCGGGGCKPRSRWMPCRTDLLLGYRRLNLDEELYIRESLTAVDPLGAVPFGTTFDIVDQFETENQFDGFDVGLGWDWCAGKLGFTALTKIAFGRARRRADIRGWTHITEPGLMPVEYDGGLLAAQSNMGHYSESDFTVIPEVGLNLYYQMSCKCRLTFGYSMIFFRDVLRPGDIVSLNVDPRQLPPPTVFDSTQPAFENWKDDFWAQGLNVGVEFCF